MINGIVPRPRTRKDTSVDKKRTSNLQDGKKDVQPEAFAIVNHSRTTSVRSAIISKNHLWHLPGRRHLLCQRLVVTAEQQPFHPPALGKRLVPPIVQMHGKDLVQGEVEPAAFLQPITLRPLPVRAVWLERVWDAVVEPAREGVAEAGWEDLERGYRRGKETAPEAEVEDRAPVGRG